MTQIGITAVLLAAIVYAVYARAEKKRQIAERMKEARAVALRLVDAQGRDVEDGVPGELLVKSPALCSGYWYSPEATAEAFVDGWFRTGDMAVLERGSYRLLGRTSVDIIKTGGFKVSALEIEEVLRTHPAIAERAVVGVQSAAGYSEGMPVGTTLMMSSDITANA